MISCFDKGQTSHKSHPSDLFGLFGFQTYWLTTDRMTSANETIRNNISTFFYQTNICNSDEIAGRPVHLNYHLFIIFAAMTRIGIISDTHGFLDETIFNYFEQCDEIWHAGDFGNSFIAEQLKEHKPLRGVYGNIDGQDIRNHFPEQLIFACEEVKVMIRHIGGSPPKYNPETRKQLAVQRPQLFICGHSHILKIMFDAEINCLHVNPGAAGKQGWHKTRTIVRLSIDGNNMKDCEVIELGKR